MLQADLLYLRCGVTVQSVGF